MKIYSCTIPTGLVVGIVVGSLLYSAYAQPTGQLSMDQLVRNVRQMEMAIRGIAWKEEWIYVNEDPDRPEMDVEPLGSAYVTAAISMVYGPDANDPNYISFGKYLWQTESKGRLRATGEVLDFFIKEADDGRILRSLRRHVLSGGRLRFTGTITHTARKGRVPEPHGSYGTIQISLLGASIYRCSVFGATGFRSLSSLLKELGRLDKQVYHIDGFKVVRADLVEPQTGYVTLRVYFAVDHNYYPVRYEHMSGGPEEVNRVGYTIAVQSLAEVLPGVWFPSSVVFSVPSRKFVDHYRAVGKIRVNDDLSAKDFELEFPAGTYVRDEIEGIEYIKY